MFIPLTALSINLGVLPLPACTPSPPANTKLALQRPKANKVSATLNPESRTMKELFYGSTAEVFQEPVLLQSFKSPAFLLLIFSLLKQQWLTQSFLAGTNNGLLPPSESEFLGHQFVNAQSTGLREYFRL